MIVTDQGMTDLLLNGTGGLFMGAKVILSNANFVSSRETVAGDLTAPLFMGYAPSAVTAWSPPFIGTDGVAHTDGGDHLFQPTGGTPSDNIYGFGIVDTGATKLLASELFPQPIPLADLFHGVLVDVDLFWGQ